MTVIEKKTYLVDSLTIADTLSSGSTIYSIPQFQRKYAWTKKEVDDLIFDLFEDIEWTDEELSKTPPYFLGSIVIAANNDLGIVLDGQQRLATISLLLAVIKKMLVLENSDKASLIDQYLMKVSFKLREDNQIRIRLQPGDAEIYNSLLRDPDQHKAKELSRSLIAKATQAIIEKLEHYIKAATSIGVPIEGALISMLERTLNLTTIVKIVSPSEADAFRLFETLNDRGLALNAADLIKNKLLSRFREKKHIDEAVERWKQIIDSVGEDEIVNFLRYYWIAFHGHTRHKELYKVFEQHLNRSNPKQSLDFIRDLSTLSNIYHQIAKPSQDKQIWKKGVNESLRRLVVYKARSCRPVLLACARNRPEDMLEVTRACEAITVRYSVVSNMGSNDLERSYAQLARALKNKQIDIRELLGKYLSIHSLPDDEFINNFTKLNILNVSDVWRQILTQFNDALSTGETIVGDAQKVHIEHIFPRNPSPEALNEARLQDKEKAARLSSMIGNLTLLSGDFNRKISNRAFSIKRPVFQASELALNKEIASKGQWSEAEITERSNRLANLAAEIWAWPIQ